MSESNEPASGAPQISGRYQQHPVFDAPEDPDAVLWRYLDFTKFVALLDSSHLFFARSDTFDDPFEGSYSRRNPELRPEVYKDVPAEALAEVARTHSEFRRWTFINCWNMSQHESAALWGLYVPPSGGVAVRSTFRRLTESFGSTDPLPDGDPTTRIYIGRVNYVDYDLDWMPEGNSMYPFVHKRRSFDFESEVRGLVQIVPHTDGMDGDGRIDWGRPLVPGLNVEVSLTGLIDTIHVSPTAPGWFADLVSSVVDRYGLNVPVTQSALAGSPVY